MEAIDHSPLSSFPVCSLSQTSGGGELHIITNQHKRAFHEFFHPKALDGTFCQCLAYIGGAGQEEQSLLKIMIESFSQLNVTHLKKKHHNSVYIQPLTFKLTFSRVKWDQEIVANTPPSSFLAVVTPGQRQRLSNATV